MTRPNPEYRWNDPGLVSGDRVVFRSPEPDPERHARLFPGSTGPAPRLERRGQVVEDPRGMWVRVVYDGDEEPSMALVETLTREEEQ